MKQAVFQARAGMGRRIEGAALVAKDGFSARYDLDRRRGVFSRPEHKLAGESYVDRVLVLDAAKGGVATAWMLHEMQARGVIPAALVLNAANPIMVQGAAFAGFHHDLRLRGRHHAGDPERRPGRGRPDRRPAVHPAVVSGREPGCAGTADGFPPAQGEAQGRGQPILQAVIWGEEHVGWVEPGESRAKPIARRIACTVTPSPIR